MFGLGFIVGLMIGGTVAIFLHCCCIIGKESMNEKGEKNGKKQNK